MLAQPTAKIASHGNNMEAFMDVYIFYNILSDENFKLTCVSKSAVQKKMWQSKGTRQSEQPLQQHRIELLYRCKFSPRAGLELRVTAGVLLLLHWIPLKEKCLCWTLKPVPKTKQTQKNLLKLIPKKKKKVVLQWFVYLNCKRKWLICNCMECVS